MLKNVSKITVLFSALLLLCLALATAVSAVAPASGYMTDNAGSTTNIKWTIDEAGVLTFEIDSAATDKAQSTVIINRDPLTGSSASWSGGLPTFAEVTKVIIGDGITEVSGFAALYSLTEVELAESVKVIGNSAFQCSGNLQSVYVRGTEPEYGVFDLSHIDQLGAYAFDGLYRLGTVIMNPDYASVIPTEAFKGTGLFSFEAPAGVTLIENGAFAQTPMLGTLIINGMDTVIASDGVFVNSDTYPRIRAKAGSKAAEFALANEYTFIDIDSGATTTGAKEELANKPIVTEPQITDFDHEGATLWGHLSGKYMGSNIINTWWAYYDDTKTLEFVSATTGYNETGMAYNVDAEYTNWMSYKDQIEHIIIGENISKITGGEFGGAFTDYPALKDVRISKTLGQIDMNAFSGCSSLTTIWVEGTERVEGRADLSGISFISDAFANTAIREYILNDAVTALPPLMSPNVAAVYAYEATEELIAFAKSNFCNLYSRKEPEAEHNYYVHIDPELPTCGLKAAFDFDSATGTLTILGAGAIDSIVNYYGGGSKTQPWFTIRNQVKHIVISDSITSIGKYAFCEFGNLESVQIPSSESFEILNAAFEKCYNLKSVYRTGTEPIEGTLDLRNVHVINSWSFAYDYLIANVIVSDKVDNIGSSVFEENINLAGIYGVPGSYAEKYASEHGLSFSDIALGEPAPVSCTPPETTSDGSTDSESDFAESASDSESEEVKDPYEEDIIFVDEVKGGTGGSGTVMLFVIVSAVAVIAATAAVIFIKKRKSK